MFLNILCECRNAAYQLAPRLKGERLYLTSGLGCQRPKGTSRKDEKVDQTEVADHRHLDWPICYVVITIYGLTYLSIYLQDDALALLKQKRLKGFVDVCTVEWLHDGNFTKITVKKRFKKK